MTTLFWRFYYKIRPLNNKSTSSDVMKKVARVCGLPIMNIPLCKTPITDYIGIPKKE